MFFAESPLGEDELVTVDETECFIERSARARREYYVGEGAMRLDRFDCAPAADSSGKEITKRAWHRRFSARVRGTVGSNRME